MCHCLMNFYFYFQSDEFLHEKKRTEHLDNEVKKLRTRIDELKKQVLVAEENVRIINFRYTKKLLNLRPN